MLEIVRVIRVLMGKKNNIYQKKEKKNNRTWRKTKEKTHDLGCCSKAMNIEQ